MAEVPTGIPETQRQKAKVIDLQAARQQRLAEGRQGQALKIQPEKGSGQIRAKIYAKLEPFPVQ